jgi:predicted TIM-barrel fold metal-dependent hydrolase
MREPVPGPRSSRPSVLDRRQTLRLLGTGLAMGLAGCCCRRAFPEPAIDPTVGARAASPLLGPAQVNKRLTRDVFCVDVHAHFFNASDVTVKGYLEGPVAHTAGGEQGRLIKLLAPLADQLAEIAPTAKEEYDYLGSLSSRAALTSPEETERAQENEISAHRQQQSKRFFDLLNTPQGRPFAEEYRRIQTRTKGPAALAGRRPTIGLDENALALAMAFGEVPRGAREPQLRLSDAGGTYAEGTLAFVGYMLSYRWANLRSYQTAFSTHEEAVGVDRVLGSLVDFDRWLDCPPRSAHEDQMRLHARMSELSGGYMLPLISYNPWTDVVDNGRSLRLVREAVTRYGFVGVKIYPPNGFRPWGNTSAQGGVGLPSHEEINRRLEAFWNTCLELDVPVMAHTNQSMGKDDAHDALGGPDGWAALLSAYENPPRSLRVNLGHFGGDTDAHANDWTERMAHLMTRANGNRVYGDLGYWSQLRCSAVGAERCAAAVNRLRRVLSLSLGNGEGVADRIMFGSDWLMLSREPDWSNYAAELFVTLEQHAPEHVHKIFGANALRCFPVRAPA